MRHLAFAADDLDATVSYLKFKVQIGRYQNRLTGKRFAFFNDPDVLPLEITVIFFSANLEAVIQMTLASCVLAASKLFLLVRYGMAGKYHSKTATANCFCLALTSILFYLTAVNTSRKA